MKKLNYLLFVISLIIHINANGQSTLLTGIEEYYKFDETSGQAIDAVGTINSSNVDATQGSSGKIGTCYLYNGTDNMVTFADHPNWTINTSDNISISAWIMLTGDISSSYANIWGMQNGPQFFLHFSSAGHYKIGWYTGNAVNEIDDEAFSFNTWYHLVMTKSGSTVTIYRDGSNLGSITAADNNVDPAVVFIGADSHTNHEPFKGKIDEMGIWGKVLTSSEVAQLYNSGSGLSYPFSSGPEDYVNFTPASPMNISSSAGNSSITVNSSGTWNASESIDWISISPAQGSDGTTLTVTVTENTSVQRQGDVTFTCGTASATLTVIQAGTGGGESYWQPAAGGGIKYTDGNVGIGTDNPQTPLHVLNNIALHGSGLDGSFYQRAQFYANTTLGLYIDAPKDASGNKLPIEFNWRGGGTPPLHINGNGNVGIGCSNPGSKLVVNGEIQATRVQITGSVPCSDYVFEKDYSMLSIEKVAEFVETNKHLPDVPSAEEFKENGYSVGEMDDLLLRKIEELTLYIIQQQKEIQKLKEQLNELKSE